MLIDYIKIVLKLYQPVRIKDLSDQVNPTSGFWCKQFLLKEFKLLWWSLFFQSLSILLPVFLVLLLPFSAHSLVS